MKKRTFALGILGLLAAGVGTAAYVVTPTVHQGTKGEAPELGRKGDFAIGTFTQEYALPGRSQITAASMVTGNLEPAERTLSVRFWYPAQDVAAGPPARYDHLMLVPNRDAINVSSQGFARVGAAPLSGQHFPLVLMSHGFRGWNTQFSALAEHLASHGYVVASIDHADVPADGVASFLLSFVNVLADRTQDQRQILADIVAQAHQAQDPRLALIDPEKIGLIGYSMGGYGALATAGAPYEFTTSPMSNLPESAKQKLAQATASPAAIDALVTFAPWGGQPDNRAWNAASLAKISVPTLVVAGDQDDVVNYREGVKWIFDSMQGTDRHLLVFREARHNIVGDNFTLPENADFQAIEFLKEPVWRSERLNAVNQHFVTAFLDLTLKGDADKAAYLNVLTPNSDDSQWPIAFGEQLNGSMAGPDQPQHWKGFQRRWAVGLEMHKLSGNSQTMAGKPKGAR